ncbi:hypothetical protein FRC08_009801 [Ceratobasidium sp. 394]|nr:hypothetical protein FRC08_009801 [Ceratobasidium sp. 394]
MPLRAGRNPRLRWFTIPHSPGPARFTSGRPPERVRTHNPPSVPVLHSSCTLPSLSASIARAPIAAIFRARLMELSCCLIAGALLSLLKPEPPALALTLMYPCLDSRYLGVTLALELDPDNDNDLAGVVTLSRSLGISRARALLRSRYRSLCPPSALCLPAIPASLARLISRCKSQPR